MSSKRMKYSAKFKLQVVKFAQESNNCATGREFCVNEKLVRDWQRQIEKLKCMPKNKCSNRGKPCQWPELEDKLLQWIEEHRQSGYIVTRNMISFKAKAMASELQITGFLASNCWCTKFLRRKNLALRQKTKIAQKLPEHLEQKITSFHSFVIKSRRKENYELVHIGNMDETPVWFDMPSARTVNEKGAKTVLVNTTGHEKSRFTVVLACMADGTKLKPMVIFKRKTLPKENFPPGVLVHCHPKGWMDEAVGRESMAVTTRRSSEKEKSTRLGLLPSSSCRFSEASSTPNKHRHRCNPRWFNQYSSTARRFPDMMSVLLLAETWAWFFHP